MTLTQIKEALLSHEAMPQKQFGQNFLFEQAAIQKIVGASDILPGDAIVEIGPGAGNLTIELAKKSAKVFAIEKDRKMIAILNDVLSGIQNVEIIEGDALKFDETKLPKNYKISANLPFYLTAPAIRKFLESKNPPRSMALIIQKEVAQRICAKPPQMSLLAVSVQFYADAKIAGFIKKNCFWPAPKVDTAIIKIIPKEKNNKIPNSADLFFKIARAGFSHPRKQLVGNFAKELHLERGEAEKMLEQCGIAPARRAETLAVADWQNLAGFYSAKNII